MRRNNIARARRISDALKEWHEDKYADEKTRIIDALGDLRHLCDLRGFSLGELDQVAEMHYRAEVGKNHDDPNFVRDRRRKS